MPRRKTPRPPKPFAAPSRPPGLPPGTLALPPDSPPPVVHVFGYGPDVVEELAVQDVSDLGALRGRWPVLWVNVNGLGDTAVVETIGKELGLHHLALEDVMNLAQRPKVDFYEAHLFVAMRLQRWNEPGVDLHSEQLSLFLGDGFVVSFQEEVGDPFDPVRDRIRRGRPALRNGDAGFLAYALMDSVVDHMFPMLEQYGDVLDDLEVRVLDDPTQDTLVAIRTCRRMLVRIRRAVWPLRDAMASLQGERVPFLGPELAPYLRDLFDHSLRLVDLTESFRDQVGGLMEGYVSSVSFRMNEVMGVLTLVGTIFLPLSFLTGLYGMNFDRDASRWNMPELGWAYGYPVLLGVMIGLSVAMLWHFKRRGWFAATGVGRGGAEPPEEG